MYHGINQNMVFNSMSAEIFSVLSTTFTWDVALQFANNKGLVIELVPYAAVKYFDCCWISKYSNECELLFIGGYGILHFENITNVVTCENYKEYLISLRIIDTMLNGYFFDYDLSISQKHFYRNGFVAIDLSILGKYDDIPESIKLRTKRLIEHELYRYSKKNYKKYINLHPYIDQLLHNITN